MTHAWNQTIIIEKEAICELIENGTDLTIDTISCFDEGWDNVVYLINGDIIFRFPRREFGVTCMKNELTLLPFLGGEVSFPFSKPEWIGRPSKIFPFPFAGYKMIPGRAVCDVYKTLVVDKNFAITLASWLKELHSVKINSRHKHLIKGDQSYRLNVAKRLARCKQNLDNYELYFSEAGFHRELLLKTINALSVYQFNDKTESYLHGDLYFRHLIVRATGELSGLIDWGDVHINHPGLDLAVGFIFTPENLENFLHAYGSIDKETFEIMRFHSFCHSMSLLPYAYQQKNETLKLWSTMVLSRILLSLRMETVYP